MVSKIIHECDRCGGICAGRTLTILVDRKMDLAGSIEDEFQNFDLCYSCSHAILHLLVSKLYKERSCEAGVEFVKLIKDSFPRGSS